MTVLVFVVRRVEMSFGLEYAFDDWRGVVGEQAIETRFSLLPVRRTQEGSQQSIVSLETGGRCHGDFLPNHGA